MCCWMIVDSCWLIVDGCWLLVVVVGCWLTSISDFCEKKKKFDDLKCVDLKVMLGVGKILQFRKE